MASSILDAGCGDGTILKAVGEDRLAIGTDISEVGLRHTCDGAHGVVADIGHLPFGGQAFDCVLCSEVLEHLTDEKLQSSVAELDRVARRYMLISVPNDEKLMKRMSRCVSCGHTFHLYGHLRAFEAVEITRLFPHWDLVGTRLCGHLETPCIEALARLKQRFGNVYFYVDSIEMLCPRCKSPLHRAKRSVLQRVVGKVVCCIEWCVVRARRLQAYPDWLVVLLERKTNKPSG